jgi:hypothetical protein
MNRTAALVLSVALGTLVVGPSAWAAKTSQTASARPPGVAASAWVPINSRMGFVVQQRATAPQQRIPTVQGYFVVKRNGSWWRLDAVPVGGVFHTGRATATD